MNDICSSDEYGVVTTDLKKTNSTKWLKSSNASLAHLQQVKPMSVYNFGITNTNDLKATNLSSQRSNSYTNLVAEPVLQPVSLQKTAWGSNGSIPDLLKSNSKNSQRPGSAKTERKCPAPRGRRQRPQSAKESVVKQGGSGIAVKGAKYDPSGRPPKSSTSTTGWIGPPAGLKFSEDRDGNPSVPPAPVGSPNTLHIDVDLHSNATHEEESSPRLKYTHAEPPRTPTPPRMPPTPIHLMLPTMYDYAEEPDEDELDTDRLLQMAEQHTSADKYSEPSYGSDEPLSKPHHPIDELPGYTYTFVNGHHSHESKLEVHEDGEREVLSWEREDVNESLDFSESECSEISTAIPGNEAEKFSQPHFLEKVSVKFSEDKNVTIDITPRNTGHKVAELMRKKPFKTDDPGELLSSLSVSSANTCNQHTKEISSPKNKVSLTEMKHENKLARTLTNNKSYTKSEKPTNGNLDFNFSSLENSKCEKSLNNRPKSAVNRPTTPISSVTVAYCDLDNAKKKKKYRGSKSDKDIITMVQQCQVSDSDEENQKEVITPDKLDPWMTTKTTSQKSKNYYELARHSGLSGKNNHHVKKPDPDLVSGAPLLKTTKTIELDEAGNEMKEVKTRSFIPVDKQPTAYLERDRQLREATRVRTKPRPASEMMNRGVSVKKNEVHTSRPDLPKEESLGQKKQMERPFSAPSHRRPMSASRQQHINKKPVKHKEEEDSVISNGVNTACPIHNQNKTDLSDVTREETVAMETDDDQMSEHSYEPDSGSDNEVIEKTLKDLEIEKIIERHLGKPSFPVELSTKENDHQKLNKKPTRTSPAKSASEKKTTAHSHLHCNCPSNSKKEEKKVTNFTVQLPSSDKVNNKVYGAFARNKSAPPLRTKTTETARPRTGKPVFITSKIPDGDFETEENVECQQLQAKLAANGVHIRADTLERALYPPSGKTKYYEVNATLPKNSSSNLLSHPKEWLPVEYRQLKLAEKALNRANEIMYRQRVAEDRKARLTEIAKKKVKGKKKGKAKGKTKDGSSACKTKT